MVLIAPVVPPLIAPPKVSFVTSLIASLSSFLSSYNANILDILETIPLIKAPDFAIFNEVFLISFLITFLLKSLIYFSGLLYAFSISCIVVPFDVTPS